MVQYNWMVNRSKCVQFRNTASSVSHALHQLEESLLTNSLITSQPMGLTKIIHLKKEKLSVLLSVVRRWFQQYHILAVEN